MYRQELERKYILTIIVCAIIIFQNQSSANFNKARLRHWYMARASGNKLPLFLKKPSSVATAATLSVPKEFAIHWNNLSNIFSFSAEEARAEIANGNDTKVNFKADCNGSSSLSHSEHRSLNSSLNEYIENFKSHFHQFQQSPNAKREKEPKLIFTKYILSSNTEFPADVTLVPSNHQHNKGQYNSNPARPSPLQQQQQISLDGSFNYPLSPSCDGFNTMIQDLSLISLILSILSFILGGISLLLSNFYNVFGSGLSLLLIGIPSLVINILTLLGVGPSSSSPIVTILTAKSTVDSLNNLFNVVPGSLFSDLLAILSLAIGKISIVLSAITTYPKFIEKIFKSLGLFDLIDYNYACDRITLGNLVQSLLLGSIYSSNGGWGWDAWTK